MAYKSNRTIIMNFFILKTSHAVITTLLFATTVFPTYVSFSQNIGVNNRVWVITRDIATEKSDFDISSNAKLNYLFSRYNVKKYEQVFPFAKTPELLDVYEIECVCDIDSLIKEIESSAPELFEDFKRLDYETTALYSPIDFMWVAHSDDWLWHLKKIQADLAWDITTGDSSVKTAVIDSDFDIGHPDLAGKIEPLYDPYDSIPFSCHPFSDHGTMVASFVAGETAGNDDTSRGQLASVGFNTKMICYKAWSVHYLQRSLHASTVMGAKILTSSSGGWSRCPDPTGIERLVVKEILDNGTTIIMPAGNGEFDTHNFCPTVDSVNHCAFFPLSPYYDDRIIIVSSTGTDDKHFNGTDSTHSHYPDVDLCAPGYNLMSAIPSNCGENNWPYYGAASGTSFSTPIVAGVAALMYSVNPCLTPAWCQDILKNTTDSIVDAAQYRNGVGTGRVNAFRAVKEAKDAYSETLDLYIKDRPEDFGNESYPYDWQADRDESPDIWVRNQPDGFVFHISQEPSFQTDSPVYVYVRVWNKSCISASGQEDLSLYWSMASSCSSWPHDWDGTRPSIGNKIGTVNLGQLSAGKDTIIEFIWDMSNPYIHQNWAVCLLARIENSPTDVIRTYPNRLDDEVFYNNNIALRNVTIVDMASAFSAPATIDSTYYPIGRYMYVGNVLSSPTKMNLSFTIDGDSTSNSIIKEAEVKIIFDDLGWQIIKRYLDNRPDIKILKNREIRILKDSVFISNVEFPANLRIPIYVGFSFLTRKLAGKKSFFYHIRQQRSEDSSLLGGVHYIIKLGKRNTFKANAGVDPELPQGECFMLEAIPINEPATYNWYDKDGFFIHTGLTLSDTLNNSKRYNLEVIAHSDGFKDYDQVNAFVKSCWIKSIAPNPAANQVTINYVADQSTSAYLMFFYSTHTISKQYPLDTFSTELNVNLSDCQTGIYTVVLVCDGIARDTKTLIVK